MLAAAIDSLYTDLFSLAHKGPSLVLVRCYFGSVLFGKRVAVPKFEVTSFIVWLRNITLG